MKIAKLRKGQTAEIIGRIVSVNAQQFKKDDAKYVVKLVLADDTGAITAVAFMGEDDPELATLKTSKGRIIRLLGEVQTNKFRTYRTLQVVIKSEYRNNEVLWHFDFEKEPAKERKIPIHYRTKKSSDARSVLNPGAIENSVITDINSIHAWPQHKGVYGVELSSKADKGLVRAIPVPESRLYAAIDLETSGLDASSPAYEIIEFGGVIVNGCGEILDFIRIIHKPNNPEAFAQASRVQEQRELLKRRKEESSKAYWERRRIYEAFNVNKITPEEMQGGLDDAEFKAQVIAWMNQAHSQGAVFAAYNANFDFLWLNRKLGIEPPPYIDIMQLAKLKDPRPDGGKYSAQAMIQHYLGADYTELHRGLEDAKEEAYLLSQLNAEPFEPDRFLTTVIIKGDAGRASFIRTWNGINRTRTTDDRKVWWTPEDYAQLESCEIGVGGPESEVFFEYLKSKEVSIPEYVTFIEMQPYNNFDLAKFIKVITPEGIKDYQCKLFEKAVEAGLPVVWADKLGWTDKIELHYLKIAQDAVKSAGFPGTGYMDDEDVYHYLSKAINPEAAAVIARSSIEFYDSIASCPVSIIPDTLQMPVLEGAKENVIGLVEAGKTELYGVLADEVIENRLADEVTRLFIEQDFASLFWLAKLAIEKSLEVGYSVGSRGSVGSSFAAFLLGVTEINPLPPHHRCPECKSVEWAENADLTGLDLPSKVCKCGAVMVGDGFGIPVESFIGVGRAKPPDIDLNFSSEIQPAIVEYMGVLLPGKTLRAGTIGAIGDRTSRKITRRRSLSGADPGVISGGELFTREDAEKLALARYIEGIKTGTGQHPGGILVFPADFDIDAWIPVQYAALNPESSIVSHYSYDTVEESFCKLDLLGHDAPTIARKLQELLDYENLKITPEMVEEIFTKGMTAGITEFHTPFARQLVSDANPKNFADLTRTCGLAHGTNVWRGNGRELKLAGRDLRDLICCRDDLFQKLLAGGLAPEACQEITDAIRKGKGLKATQRAFMWGAGCPKWYIKSAEKIKYLFPKAHAAAYSLSAGRQAAAKIKNPAIFFSVVLSAHAGAFDADLMLFAQQDKSVVKDELARITKIIDAFDPGLATGDERREANRAMKQLPILEIFAEIKENFPEIKFDDLSLTKSQIKDFTAIGNAIFPPLAVIKGIGDKGLDRLSDKQGLELVDALSKAQAEQAVKLCPEISGLLWWGAHLAGEPGRKDLTKLVPILGDMLQDPKAKKSAQLLYKKLNKKGVSR